MEDTDEVRSLVRRYLPERLSGKELSTLRRSMLDDGVAEEVVRVVIRRIDDLHLEQLKKHASKTKLFEQMILGVVLLLIGLIITTLSLTGMVGQRYIIVFFGPIFYGGYLAYTSWTEWKGLRD